MIRRASSVCGQCPLVANVHSSFVYISFWKSTSSTNSEAKVLTELLSHGYTGEESVEGFDFLEGRISNNHLFVSELLCGSESARLGNWPPTAGLVCLTPTDLPLTHVGEKELFSFIFASTIITVITHTLHVHGAIFTSILVSLSLFLFSASFTLLSLSFVSPLVSLGSEGLPWRGLTLVGRVCVHVQPSRLKRSRERQRRVGTAYTEL